MNQYHKINTMFKRDMEGYGAKIQRGGGNYRANGDFEAEGIVARPDVELLDRRGKRVITKIKAVDFRKK